MYPLDIYFSPQTQTDRYTHTHLPIPLQESHALIFFSLFNISSFASYPKLYHLLTAAYYPLFSLLGLEHPSLSRETLLWFLSVESTDAGYLGRPCDMPCCWATGNAELLLDPAHPLDPEGSEKVQRQSPEWSEVIPWWAPPVYLLGKPELWGYLLGERFCLWQIMKCCKHRADVCVPASIPVDGFRLSVATHTQSQNLEG